MSAYASSPLTLALLLAGSLITWAAPAARAAVSLPAVFTDNMVLQRGMKIPVWGWSAPGEGVTVTLNGRRATATADASGRWETRLPSMAAGGPYEMTVTGTNGSGSGAQNVNVRNVLIGEVWVASGQSNMQFSLHDANFSANAVAAADLPNLRLFTVPDTVAGEPQSDVKASWQVSDPKTAEWFSAVAFFFGQKLHADLNVPIGLIHTSWGGTPAEAWTPWAAMEKDPMLQPILARWEGQVKAYPAQREAYDKALADWNTKAAQSKADGQPEPDKPNPPEDPRQSSWRPAGLYNAMIAPLVPYGVRGAIWYQGESNAGRAVQYQDLFATMIRQWRAAWGQGDFPFLFVQLANWQPGGDSWAELREAQTKTLALPNTGMAMAVDIGDTTDIHPKNKREVGRRLALVAEATVYGLKQPYSGPMFRSMTVEGNRIHLAFDHADGGLKSRDGGPLKGFTVATEGGPFVPATARVEGETVVVWSDAVAHPAAARYAWGSDPEVSLFNGEDLPASPFRTDTWRALTQDER